MSIYEAVGGMFIILMACIGVYTVGHFTVIGLRYTGSRIEAEDNRRKLIEARE